MGNNNEKGTVLVVSNDREINLSLKGFFAALEYKMLTALNGNEAMKIIDSVKDIDFMLLDVKLRGISGIEILKRVKKECPKTKVVIITGFGDKLKKLAEDIGVNGFLDKPIDFSTMIGMIKYILCKKKDGNFHPANEGKGEILAVTPKAKLLFIEPSVEMHAYTSALFNNPDFCRGEYEKKAIYHGIDDLSGNILNDLMMFQPDIVLINDYAMSEGDILNMIDLIRKVKIQPDEILIHGLFERSQRFEVQLNIKRAKRCIQNVMNSEQLMEMNQKLIDFVNNECIEHGLVKK